MQSSARTWCSVSDHARPVRQGLARAATIESPLGHYCGLEDGDAVAHVWGCWLSHSLVSVPVNNPFLAVPTEYDGGRGRVGGEHCDGSGIMARKAGLRHEQKVYYISDGSGWRSL